MRRGGCGHDAGEHGIGRAHGIAGSVAGVFSNPDMSMNGPLGGAEGGCEGEG